MQPANPSEPPPLPPLSPSPSRRGRKLMIAILAVALALAILIGAQQFRQAMQLARQDACTGHLQAVGQAIGHYQERHRGAAPADLSSLAKESLIDSALLQCPAVANRACGYFYYPPAANRTDGHENRIIACDLVAHRNGMRSILYSDSSVKLCDATLFELELAKPENADFSAAFTATPKPPPGGG